MYLNRNYNWWLLGEENLTLSFRVWCDVQWANVDWWIFSYERGVWVYTIQVRVLGCQRHCWKADECRANTKWIPRLSSYPPPFLSVSLPSWIFLRDSLRWSGQYTIIYSFNAFWLIIDYSPGVVIGEVKYYYFSKSIFSETPLEKFYLQKSSQHPKLAAFLTTNRLHSDFAPPDLFLDSSSERNDS